MIVGWWPVATRTRRCLLLHRMLATAVDSFGRPLAELADATTWRPLAPTQHPHRVAVHRHANYPPLPEPSRPDRAHDWLRRPAGPNRWLTVRILKHNRPLPLVLFLDGV